MKPPRRAPRWVEVAVPVAICIILAIVLILGVSTLATLITKWVF